jgi:hypothetical protein
MTYRSIRVPRVSVWACFSVTDGYGNPLILKSRVVFWGLTEEGEPVGLVIGSESGLPESAQRFSNFVRYEYPKRSVQRVPDERYVEWEAPR